MTLDFTTPDELPEGLRPRLRGPGEGALRAVRTYCDYHGILEKGVSLIRFSSSQGHISDACMHAEEIAKHFNALVEFVHNDRPVTVFPSAARAAVAAWNKEKSG